MKRSMVFLLQSGFWGGFLLIWVFVLGILSQSNLIEESEMGYYAKIAVGVILVPAITSFYTFYTFLFPRYLQKNKIGSAILGAVALALVSALVGSIALYLLLGFNLECHQMSNFLSIAFMSGIGLICGTIGLVIKGFITWFEELKMKEALLLKNHQMELALVKAQLDPHFLFNTINNIDVLIIKDPQEASIYLNKLSDIMRFMLFETKVSTIQLVQEIEYIEKYIDLQKIRTANPNYVRFHVQGDTAQKQIAPMVFIPFIENAFKHTTNKKLEKAIDIQVIIGETSIELMCKNKVDPHHQSPSGYNGLGNNLIQKRLQLMYPTRHTLVIDQQEDFYQIHLTIHDDPIS